MQSMMREPVAPVHKRKSYVDRQQRGMSLLIAPGVEAPLQMHLYEL
jgi:hypothetical protein